MNTRPIVDWQTPDKTPDVPKYGIKKFWIAISIIKKGKPETIVFDAQYVNKPLEFEPDDIECECPLDDEHFVTRDGEPMEAVGWFSLMEHVDFNGFYEPILFDDQYKLLGWGEYLEPEFNLRGFDKNNPVPE